MEDRGLWWAQKNSPRKEWCREQMWALLVRKTKGQAQSMIISLNNLPKSRGVRAWYKLMREAKGGITTQVHEVTERLYSTARKQVPAKDVVPAIEEFENETRKYQEVTGDAVKDSFLVLSLKRILPDKIRDMLQTADLAIYKECKDYATKQARVIRHEKGIN